MEKLPHCLGFLFNNRIFSTTLFVLVLGGSYYVYKQLLPLFSSGCNKQMWKKIPFIQKKVENEIQKMKENNDEDDKSFYNKLVENLRTSGVTKVDIANINTIQETGLNKETLMTYLQTSTDLRNESVHPGLYK